jgi:hypothetical protein
MTKYLNKEDFKNAAIKHNVEVAVPKLGGSVFIKHINVQQRNNLLASLIEYDDKGKAKVSPAKMGEVTLDMVALSVVDDTGVPIFTAQELKDLPADMSDVIELLFAEANKVNPITLSEEKNTEKN